MKSDTDNHNSLHNSVGQGIQQDLQGALQEALQEALQQANNASILARNISIETRNILLQSIKETIQAHADEIIEANARDIARAKEEQLATPLLNRLKFDNNKINEVSMMIDAVIAQEDLLYKTILKRELASGLILHKRLVPLGTIGFIFESRPDALVQMAALCLKTANGVLMKGGREALETNKLLHKLIVDATEATIPGWIQLLETRDEIDALIKTTSKKTVDLIIPRGSNEFVSYIMQNSQVPVLGHADGICHLYVHEDADCKTSAQVLFDAKLQYPAVCNSVECVIVHSAMLNFLGDILQPLAKKNVLFYADERSAKQLESLAIPCKPASETTWNREYSDAILAIKVVDDMKDAVDHINTYGSGHTDIIMTLSETSAREFQNTVDSSSVLWNCSSRFADGFRYGLGAEVGISTSKIHARGPMGAEGLLTTQWVLDGDGHVVAPFVNGDENFTHKDLL